MDNELDQLLRHALIPTDEPDFRLNQKIVNQAKTQNEIMGRKKKSLSTAVAAAASVLCLSSVTVYAAWRVLLPEAVAKGMQDTRLADALVSEDAFVIDETQSYGDYSVTLLSIVSGEMLSDYTRSNEKGIITDRTYAVVAIENADGMPMPDTSEDAYGDLEFFASPLIGDYDPAFYNIASMSGDYTEMTEDGVLYRILACDNVAIFADHDLYLCVSEGGFYNKEAYQYDELTGRISRNESYAGLNALFQLPMDTADADPEKAAEYIAGLGLESDIAEEKLKVELDEAFKVEAAENNEQGAEAAEYALQFVGNPYAWGGDSLTDGTDSSGFTKSVYEHFEISLPHNNGEQCELGTEVEDIENAEPGDLIFYETPAHVAIYIGDGLVVHAMPQEGICVSEVDFDEIAGIRRIFNVE